MNRKLSVLIIFLVVIIAGFLYFSREEISFSKDTSVYKAIPVSCPFFFEFNSIRPFPFEDPPIQEFIQTGTGKGFFELLHKLDTLIQNSDNIPGTLRNSPFILSFGFTGRNEIVPLLVKNAESSNRKNSLESLIHTLYSPHKYSYIEKEYGKYKIFEIARTSAEGSVFFSFTDKVLLISSKSILVEQAIRQLETIGILSDPYFLEISRSSDNQGVSLFVNHNGLPVFFKGFLNTQSATHVDEFGETISSDAQMHAEKFKDYAAWSELDFRFGRDHLLLNGISAADDSLYHFLSVFADQQPVRFRAEEFLPQNTSFFCNFSFSDKDNFFERLEEFFTHSGFYYRREERMKRFERGMRANVRNIFKELVKDEIVVATTTIPVNPENKTVFFVLHTHNGPAAEDQLQNLLINYGARTETGMDEMRLEYTIDDKTSFPIYRFPYPSFPGIWLGTPFVIAEAKYVAFYDNYMVFCNSERGLTEYLRSMVLDATLAKYPFYMQFRQNNPNRANFNVYIDVNKAFGFGKEIFSNSFMEQISENEESVRKFRAANWQVQRDNGVYLNSVLVSYDPYVSEEAQTIWQSIIGSNIDLKPQWVVNHNDKANREIIVQDKNNNLHQVTGKGKVRWTIPLPGPVLSEIHQVDYYKNGNLQYLFNTKEKLYLIDREGNNVAHFPVTLPSPATNGVNVFDYDNNRNYRYFVAGEDKSIYAFDYSGKIVKGWEFGQTEHHVTTPVQHFRVAGKDYIVFKDRSRIYIQDRRGETRVSTSARFENSNNPLVLNLVGTPKIVATGKSGHVHYIYFDGKQEEKKTSRFGEDHFFTVDDLDGNGIPDFVFIDNNELTVMDENGKKQFSKKLNNPLRHPPNIYTFADNLKKVGVVDADANRIYLFSPDGKLHEGFPLQGNSEFSIGKLSDSHSGLSLIVGSEGGKLYNYSLN